MSYLDKLLIRGIRSFNPNEKDNCIVEFTTPLTLIAGANGAGKTTIIECLRYVTTGDLPPNARGGAFVCDPKLMETSVVKASIKVKFRDTIGNTITCLRILQSTQKIKKIEQKQLDGSMERVDKATGEVYSLKCKLTTRCGEIDEEMVNHMGVSKAILNNVIFCHQEDSNWPLSEGKALKTRFDEIFASTRYSKALDSIKKLRLEQMAKTKEYTLELKHLEQYKEKSDELKKRINDTQKKLDALKADSTRITNQLQPKKRRIEELDSLYDEYQSKQRKLAELRSSKKELVKVKQGLLERVGVQLSESEDEIRTMVDRHNQQLERDQRSIKEHEESSRKLADEQNRLKSLHSDQSKEYGRLEVECKQYKEEIARRGRCISRLAEELGIAGYSSIDGEPTNASIRQFLCEVVEFIRRKEENGEQRKAEFQSAENEAAEQIKELRDSISRSLQTKEMKKKQLDENAKVIQTVSRQLARVGGANATFDQLDQDLKMAERELEDYNGSIDVPALENELEQLSVEKRSNNTAVSNLQQELTIITQQSSARGALESLQKQKKSKEQEYHKTIEEVENELLSVTGSVPSSEDVLNSIDTFERTKKAGLKKAQFKCSNLSKSVASLKAQHDEKLKQLKRKRDELQVLEGSVRSVCGTTSYLDKKAKIEQDKAKLEEDLATVKGSQTYFKQCLSKTRSTKKCPLCARGYETQEGLEGLITSIERRLNNKVPELVQTYERQLKEADELHQQMILIKPKMDKIQELKDKEISSIERNVSSLKSEMDKTNQDLETEEKTHSQSQSALDQISKLRPKASSIAHLQEDLKRLDHSISAEVSKLESSNSSFIGSSMESQQPRTQAVVHRELKKAQMLSEELGMKMDNKRKEISGAEKCGRELENKVQQLRKEKLELQEQVQQRHSLTTKKEELSTINEGLKRDIDAATRQLKNLQSQLKGDERKWEQCKKEREKFEEEHRRTMSSVENMKLNVESSNNNVKKYEARGSNTALHDCTAKMDELTQQIEDKNMERSGVEETIDKLRRKLANAEVRKRELLDNLELHSNQKTIDEKELKINGLEQQMRQLGLNDYDNEYGTLQGEVDKLRKEKARLEGHTQGKQEELRHSEKDLNSPMYKDIDKRFKDTKIMLETTVVSQDDLEKYYKALDRAIMNFHGIKMEEINRIIKDLWIKTYKGTDIDTIKVVSESDLDASTALSNRRTYNYRVVMVKGSTELDMRGRCSAGQKVLASIIIRLALAETFSLNCGVMVLDEPTTNLDSENMEGLAYSLLEIIKERRRHKHFQLILITHDMKFVEIVGHAGVVDEYSLVKKENGYFSTIRKTPISKLSAYN